MASIPITGKVAPRFLRARFIACVFAGSFLLFLVQPMVARMALPRLGGAPSVWNSAMLVYQALLLAGYAYAHLLGRLEPRRQAMVHLTLFALAGLSLPIALIGATPPPDANIFVWVPWLLVVSIGPLFLVVSAQAPLIQRWFALAGGGDPYPLYAASNLGSFLGLITYPLIVEPLLPVAAQSLVWSLGYGLLALLVAVSAVSLPRVAPPATAAVSTPRPTRRDLAGWIGLAAIPSGLMLSTTLHLTTDIVAMPLLWVLPLGLYLLSYSVAFATARGAARIAPRIAPFALLIAGCSTFADATPAPLVIAATSLFTLFVVAVTLHARLYDTRPDPAHLTIFYLSTSVGGVIGGLFCALIAPLAFDWTYEHPLLLVAAALTIVSSNPFARLAARWDGSARAARSARWLGGAALLVSLTGWSELGLPAGRFLPLAGEVAILVIGIVAIGHRRLFTLTLIALMLALGGWSKLELSLSGRMTRSFFGVYSVREVPGGGRMLVHGTTVHGVENFGSLARERMLTSYYAPHSGVADALAAVPVIFPRARVGIVGLGAGTLGCAGQPGQSWRFYEIDPKVVAIARDARQFRFLAHCQPTAPIVVGDARLMLGREPANSADVLVVDAFSSDSVPMHLLTLEAFALYRRHLAANGLLLVHISNRYLDLRPVVAAAAAHGWTARARVYRPEEAERTQHATGSEWVMLSPAPSTIAAVEAKSGADRWEALAAPTRAAWTDDYASILPLIRWRG